MGAAADRPVGELRSVPDGEAATRGAGCCDELESDEEGDGGERHDGDEDDENRSKSVSTRSSRSPSEEDVRQREY